MLVLTVTAILVVFVAGLSERTRGMLGEIRRRRTGTTGTPEMQGDYMKGATSHPGTGVPVCHCR